MKVCRGYIKGNKFNLLYIQICEYQIKKYFCADLESNSKSARHSSVIYAGVEQLDTPHDGIINYRNFHI